MNRMFIGTSPKMMEDALNYARESLGVDYLDSHPDYLSIRAKDGKSQLVIDDIVPVVEKGMNPPSLASKAIAIIEGAEKLNIEAQNKLLKTIEDSPYIEVIFLVGRDILLKTVKSRCSVTEYRNLTRTQFFSKFSSVGDGLNVLYDASEGDESLAAALIEHLPLLTQVSVIVKKGREEMLLPSLHLLKEKDKEAIADNWLYRAVISVLEEQYLEFAKIDREYVSILHMLSKEKSDVLKPWYIQNNFVSLIISVVEEARRIKKL